MRNGSRITLCCCFIYAKIQGILEFLATLQGLSAVGPTEEFCILIWENIECGRIFSADDHDHYTFAGSTTRNSHADPMTPAGKFLFSRMRRWASALARERGKQKNES